MSARLFCLLAALTVSPAAAMLPPDAGPLPDSSWAEARQLLLELLRVTPADDPSRAHLLFRLGELQWERAGAHFRAAFDAEEACLDNGLSPVECRTRRTRGLESAKQARAAALELYKRVAREYPHFERLDAVFFALASSYAEAGATPQALKLYAALLRSFPRTEYRDSALFALGELHYEGGSYGSAAAAFRQIEEPSLRPEAMYRLGWCHVRRDNWEVAERAFVAAADIARSDELRRRAASDALRAHARRPDSAPPTGLALARHLGVSAEVLAAEYRAIGRTHEALFVCRRLLAGARAPLDALRHQYDIAVDTRDLGEDRVRVAELRKLIAMYERLRRQPGVDRGGLEHQGARVEALLVEAIREHHHRVAFPEDER